MFQVPEPPPEQEKVPLPLIGVLVRENSPVKLQDLVPAITRPKVIWPLDIIVPVPLAGEVTVTVPFSIVAVTDPDCEPVAV